MAIKVNKFTTLTATLAAAATSGTLTSAAFDNGTAVPLTLEYDNSAKIEVITADISGTALTNIVRAKDGTADIEHTGTPKICQGSDPETWKYWLNNKTDANLLGYAEITTTFSSTATPTVTDVTNLAVTVTVPAGGRRVKITAYAPFISSTGAVSSIIAMYIKEGATVLSEALVTQPTTAFTTPVTCIYSAAAVAGSHTYKVSISQSAAGTMLLGCAATYPAFILVELI